MRILCILSFVIVSSFACAQDSAPSSHMVFDDQVDGDIVINEVRVPKDGAAMFTYYEALGWRGNGAGYAGIQVHPRARNFIFSIWDHQDHTAPIKAVHRGPGTETQGFGGEGTGLKSWNFELGWKTDVWYTLVARNWPVGDHTHFGFWVRAGDSQKWTHLVTMDVAAPQAKFRGGTDAFIEDWLNTGAKPRTTNLRNGWKRTADGRWKSFAKARYSVNSWDLVKGKRSFNYRRNWDGGVAKDETGPYYYMTAGGEQTKPTTENPSLHAIPRTEKQPSFPVVAVTDVKAATKDGQLVVRWEHQPASAPIFAYTIKLFDSPDGKGALLKEARRVKPHGRDWKLDLSQLKSAAKSVSLQFTDIFDQTAPPTTVSLAEVH